MNIIITMVGKSQNKKNLHQSGAILIGFSESKAANEFSQISDSMNN